jgi:hypothetical protein
MRLSLAALVLIGLILWRTPAHSRLLALAMAAVLVLLAAAVLWLPSWLVVRDTAAAELTSEQRATAINGARTTLVQGVVGLAALAGILVAWQQLQTDRANSTEDRRQLTEQLTLTRQGQVAERFTRAVEQLGGDELEQQLGGIFALERIAEESTSTRLQVFDVLSAYVRQHGTASEPIRIARVPDVQAALTVLGRRMVLATDRRLDLHGVNLRAVNLNSAKLQHANLTGARLRLAMLNGAQLQGSQLFSADLQSANFGYAQLQGANFGNAQLQGANLGNAQLQGANLYGAQLQFAQLQGANLTGAQLQVANLGSARLEGAILTGAQFQGATDSVSTVWPTGFDPKAHGVTRKRRG